MKKVLAIILTLALVLSLGVTAFAAGTGSITITNATKDKTYDLYKIFDATYAVDGGGNVIVGADGKAIVSYTIKTTDPLFDDMFGTDGTQHNPYFIYTAATGVVTKRDDVTDSAIIEYLDLLTDTATPDRSVTATGDTVVFDALPTGYYLIDRGISSFVTLTSNMPDVEVIDKNQSPNVDNSFSKLVYDEDTGSWVKSSSANIGDIIDWKIDFIATNYDGDEIVKYYTIRDTKSSSLWVEFDTIRVKVGSTVLEKGYYYCANDAIATGEWDYLGDWGATTKTPNNADWYLIHYGYDEFEIVIPWLDDYTFTGIQSMTKGYELTFDLVEDDGDPIESESKYASPVTVELQYEAAVGPDAANTISKNSAVLDWVTPEGTFGPEDPEVTETRVYNLGLTKTANDGTPTTPATRLEGAIFELYSDAACTKPVYVIPTNNEGVYILDDVDTVISGTNKVYTRDKYVGYWESYIGTPTTNKRNDMVTPASGQLVVMGLEAGTYYMKETKAPEGYNMLTEPVMIKVGDSSVPTSVYSNGYKDLAGNDVTYTVFGTIVQNNRGVELPSTGGKGTIMLITFGTLIAMGFAVLLITQKKMSIYKD